MLVIKKVITVLDEAHGKGLLDSRCVSFIHYFLDPASVPGD
jgi:hypothetical protein